MKRILVLGLTLMFSTAALAEVKIGFIDFQKAIQATSTGKKAKDELEKAFGVKKKELEQKEAALKKKSEDFEKKKSLLSEEVRNRQQAEFQKEVMEFRQNVAESEMDIQKRQAALTQPILEKLQKAVAEVAKEKALTLVLHQSDKMPTIAWADKSIDLTDEVVKRFEKK